MATFTIVGKRLSPSAFSDYAAHVPLEDWTPDLVVLHNTAVPSLADRPDGFSATSMEDLRHYYADLRGWHGGPHLFVDGNGIWLFNPLDRPGVHSPSWNSRSWGVEMLGDYESESFGSGPGLRVRENAVAALAALFRRLGLPPDDAHFKLHREDPRTTHLCPGKNVHKDDVRGEIETLLGNPSANRRLPAKIVVYRKGRGQAPAAVLDAILEGGTLFAEASTLSAATGVAAKAAGRVPVRAFVGDRFAISWNGATNRAYLVER